MNNLLINNQSEDIPLILHIFHYFNFSINQFYYNQIFKQSNSSQDHVTVSFMLILILNRLKLLCQK
jgi:hypothetical protein